MILLPGRLRLDLPDLRRRALAFGRALPAALAPMQAWSLWAVLLAGVLLGLATVRTPAPRPITAPSDQFSAERAFRDVQAIGRVAHPTGSTEAEMVRRYLYDRLQSLGLLVEIHAGEAAEFRRDRMTGSAAQVQNIVATLPGSDPMLPAVAVMAHADSVPNSPGAADDGAGVATLLEIARSLAADKPHDRTMLFVITDGEEPGLLGARAFFSTDPAAKRVGVVLNMDPRGDAGRASMFQLGPDSGGLLRAYGQEGRAPFANSLTALLFKILPNDTDFSIAIAKGVPGLNFSFIGDQLAYHTPLSTPEHLSRGSLQHLGGQVLPTARALADAPTLPTGAAPAAYADLFGLTLLILPFWAGLLLWAFAAALVSFAVWRAFRQGLARRTEVLRGAGVAFLAVLAAGLALQAAGALLGSDRLRIYALVGRYDLLFGGCAVVATAAVLAVLCLSGRARGWWAIAAAALAAGLMAQLGGLSLVPLAEALLAAALGWAVLRETIGPWSLWLGALGLAVVVTGALQLAAPGAAPLFLLPTLLGAAAAAVVFGVRPGEATARLALLLAALLAVVTLGWLCGWASGLFSAAGPFLPALLAPFVLLALIVAAPFARLWTGLAWAPQATTAIAIAGVAILAWVGLAPPTARRPRPTIAYVVRPAPDGPALKVAPSLDPWTRRLLPNPHRLDLSPVFARPVWASPAGETVHAPAPALDALRLADRIIIHVRPNGGARRLSVWLRSAAALSDPRLDAHAIGWSLKPGRWSRLDLHAPPPEGFTLSVAAPPNAEIELVGEQLVDGWPAGEPLPRKPPGYMAFGDSETTLGLARLTLRPQPRATPDVPPEALVPDRGDPF